MDAVGDVRVKKSTAEAERESRRRWTRTSGEIGKAAILVML
jgi:hypothetical protein